MACNANDLAEYLRRLKGDDPIDAVACTFASEQGAGMGMEPFLLFVMSFVGLGLTVRAQHPGPIMVSLILSGGLVARRVPGLGAKIMALVIFFGLAGVSLVIYQRAQTTL